MYLTPARFRTLGTGIDLTGVTDATLAATCERASAMIDSACAVPFLPVKHDFRGGTITGEQHKWRIPDNTFDLGQRRYYPFHDPLTSVQQFRIYVTNTQYVEIQPSDMFINRSEGYVEVVSLALTSVGLFNALIIPNVGLATPTARMNYTYGYDFPVTGEWLTNPSGDLKTYQGVNQWWDATIAATVYKNGTAITSGFTLDYDEGTVTFTSALISSDVVRADYTYKLPTGIFQATALTVAAELGEDELRGKGMTKLASLEIAEVQLRRTMGRMGAVAPSLSETVPPSAMTLLAPYVFQTVR